ncbi:hypothetical protein QUB60_13335 [Microcoleus sp. A2-C5]|uniref:hypothetical protein n=1 Tax=Microcoleaceae TaxID=1892252 RepID=UPI002237136F|nr:hypothetical protein [Lyngbya sp. CCAP 1446/10]MCW6051675.1 hypothetical protein [Lyngbya sp. CCAP 1446/10]
MGKITARQTISAMVALPIVLMTNTTQAVATDTSQKIEPNKQVSNFGDELDLEMVAPTTTILIEESEDWDLPDFSATNLDMEIDKILIENVQVVIEEPPPVVYLSAARGQQSRECKISAVCE